MNLLTILCIKLRFIKPDKKDMHQFKKFLLIFTLTFPVYSHAQDSYDAYDPFADYSEFEEASEEEADINFFKNGRFLALGLVAGYRGFSSSLGKIYEGGMNYGIALNYFFDLKFSVVFSYTSSDHPYTITENPYTQSGTVEMSGVGFDVRYYLNTQNVTKGLAKFNPYLSLGYSSITLTQTITNQPDLRKNSVGGFDLGVGTEFPLMRGKMYAGFEFQYQLVNWPGEGTRIVIDDGSGGSIPTNVVPTGDAYRLLGSIGINF